MFKRKNYIVSVKFQLTLVFVNLFTLLILSVAIFVQNRLAFKAMKDLGHRSHLSADQPYYQFLQMQEKAYLKYIIITTLISSIVTLVTTLFYSNRVAGPVVRLTKYFKNIRETGKIPDMPMRLRKNDYFYELFSTIQEAFESLSRSGGQYTKHERKPDAE